MSSKAFLKIMTDRALLLRRLRISCIIQFNAYFHCFRKGGYYFKNNDLQFHLIDRNNDLLLTVVVAYSK